eukprot:12425702-Prorocentrum_lima.AAC.1
MTSSLVGSEMCIRDRSRARHASALPAGGREPEGLGLGEGVGVRQCSSSSVSYTHLTLPTICSV